jgi:hypothetical protein
MKEKIRSYLIDFVRILMLYLSIRLILAFLFEQNKSFNALELVKSQLQQAVMLAGLLAVLRVFARPAKK